MNWSKVGVVDVDSGTIMVGDPCYHLYKESGDSATKLDFHEIFGKDWDAFCDLVEHGHQPGVSLFGSGTAVTVTNFGGDGTFPVYVKRDVDGRISAVMINFDNVEDNDD